MKVGDKVRLRGTGDVVLGVVTRVEGERVTVDVTAEDGTVYYVGDWATESLEVES